MRRHLDVDQRLRHAGEAGLLRVLPAEAGKHQFLARVFVIHREEPVRACVGRAGHREIAQIVGVVAELPGLCRGRLVQRIEGRRAGQHRIAPADQDVGVVAFRDGVALIRTGGDLLEVEGRGRVRRLRLGALRDGHREGRDRGRDRRHRKGAPHQVAAAEAARDDVAEGGVGAVVRAAVLGLLESLRARQGRTVHRRLSVEVAASLRARDVGAVTNDAYSKRPGVAAGPFRSERLVAIRT